MRKEFLKEEPIFIKTMKTKKEQAHNRRDVIDRFLSI